MFKNFLLLIVFSISCSTGKLTVIADLPHDLNEVSAIEITNKSDLLWMIEDNGNKNHLYGLDEKGRIIKDIEIPGVKNNDWEDLTSDKQGNIYIGDFGNNSKKRKHFSIIKVEKPHKDMAEVKTEIIAFTMPKGVKSQDMEAFFLYKENFYMFSKAYGKCVLLKVPNTPGNHVAELKKEFKLKSKRNRITAADISKDGKTVVLLNHDKVWLLTDFENDTFFKGKRDIQDFNHLSQKEGVCFKTNKMLYITDERGRNLGSNVYSYNLDADQTIQDKK